VVSDILDAGVSTPGRAIQRLSRIPHSGYQDFLTAAERSLRYNLNRCRQIKRSGRTSRQWPTSAEPRPEEISRRGSARGASAMQQAGATNES